MMMHVSQDFFGGRLTVSDTLVYNDLHTLQSNGPGTISLATVFGPGSGKGGQINPFFQAPAAAPATNTEQVSWVDLLNPLPTTRSTEDVIYNRVNATYNIDDNFHFDLDWVLAQNNYISGTYDAFCSSCAYLALNGTALAGGSATTTDISGRNVIALNTPLTTANALDVWNPAGSSNRTSASGIRSLSSAQTVTPIYNSTNQVRGSINGTPVQPAGGRCQNGARRRGLRPAHHQGPDRRQQYRPVFVRRRVPALSLSAVGRVGLRGIPGSGDLAGNEHPAGQSFLGRHFRAASTVSTTWERRPIRNTRWIGK